MEVKIKGCPPTMPGLAAKLSTPAVTEVAVRVDELVVGDTVYEVEYTATVGKVVQAAGDTRVPVLVVKVKERVPVSLAVT
jgi:hypothetical protein